MVLTDSQQLQSIHWLSEALQCLGLILSVLVMQLRSLSQKTVVSICPLVMPLLKVCTFQSPHLSHFLLLIKSFFPQLSLFVFFFLFVSAESLFNRRVEEKAKEMLFTPLGWHHSSLDQLREENGEKKAMERLL